MTSAYENAMSNTQSENYTQQYPVTSLRDCPVCGEPVTVIMFAGQMMLDYHHDKRFAYKKWCAGSDMNLSEAAG